MDLIIIDDEPKVRNGLNKIIKNKYGDYMNVETFTNGVQGLEYLETNPVDIIISDIKMPKMNGLDMIEKLREENNSSEIIILSGYSSFEYAQKAIDLRVRKYMTKPTDISALFNEIDSIKEELDNTKNDKQTSNLIVNSCIKYIEENYGNKLTLKIISEAIFVSPNYLCRLFKKEMDINLFDYIQNFRLEKAKILLDDVSYKVFEVSDMVGYTDNKYFSNLFKKTFGMTPLEYRNRS